MPKKSFTDILNRYYIISIIIVLIIGFVATYLTYKKVKEENQEELLTNISIIANTLNWQDIKTLNGNSLDLNNPNYKVLKNKLEKINSLNNKNRFLYLWTYRDNKVLFLVDSEPTNSEDYSPPGQIYDEATELDKNVLLGIQKNGIEFSEDRWGHWLTALVPILDENQNIVAVLGVDMDSKVYWNNIYTTIAIPILSTLFVLLIIIIGLILKQKENQYLALKEKLISVARHELRAPLTALSWLTETMLNDQEKLNNESIENIKNIHIKIGQLKDNVNKIIEEK